MNLTFLSPNHQHSHSTGWMSFLSPNSVKTVKNTVNMNNISKRQDIIYNRDTAVAWTELLEIRGTYFMDLISTISPNQQLQVQNTNKTQSTYLVAWFHSFNRKSTASFYAGSLITNTGIHVKLQ